MLSLEDYRNIVSDKTITNIYQKARRLYGKRVMEVNSTYVGGGVAEMLQSLIHLMNDIGIETDWGILHGSPDFFEITKRFHNALQGNKLHLTEIKKNIYLGSNEAFYSYTHLRHDAVIIHDVQPLPLIKFAAKREPWIWRCHVDLTSPDRTLWEFIKQFILRYDLMVVSHKSYLKKNLPLEQRIIFPAIDPLSTKNMDISEETVEKTIKKFGIKTDKPIIVQVSRFDPWKDPEGVLRVFGRIKKEVDCRLVLCGSMATDDPDGMQVYERIRSMASKWIRTGDVIMLTTENNILVNSLQRISEVVIQKSIREGFGLTVSEALWKETPVVGSNVGGIPLQIKDGVNGYLVDPSDIEGCASRVLELLHNPDLAREMGRKGKEIVRGNFLITRLLLDWLELLAQILN